MLKIYCWRYFEFGFKPQMEKNNFVHPFAELKQQVLKDSALSVVCRCILDTSSKRFECCRFKITGCVSRTALKQNCHVASIIYHKYEINYKQ